MRRSPLPAKKKFVQFAFEVFTPVFMAASFLLRLIYKLFFSWWVEPALRRSSQESFIADIRDAAPFLFLEYQARQIPSPRTDIHDRPIDLVYFSIGTLLFQFSRLRQEYYDIRVAPAFAPRDWCELLEVLRVIDPAGRDLIPWAIVSLHQFARLVEPNFRRLETAFEEANFQQTRQRLNQHQIE